MSKFTFITFSANDEEKKKDEDGGYRLEVLPLCKEFELSEQPEKVRMPVHTYIILSSKNYY